LYFTWKLYSKDNGGIYIYIYIGTGLYKNNIMNYGERLSEGVKAKKEEDYESNLKLLRRRQQKGG